MKCDDEDAGVTPTVDDDGKSDEVEDALAGNESDEADDTSSINGVVIDVASIDVGWADVDVDVANDFPSTVSRDILWAGVEGNFGEVTWRGEFK